MWGADHGYGGMMGFGGFGGFFGLLFWLVLIVAGIAVFRWIFMKTNGTPQGPSALEILNRRYAAGEITEEEYLRRKKQIQGSD